MPFLGMLDVLFGFRVYDLGLPCHASVCVCVYCLG